MIAVHLLSGASPAIARHFRETPNIIVSFEIAVEDYPPDVVREAAVRMLKGLKSETRDYIPDAFRLADYCETVTVERRRADEIARSRELAAQEEQQRIEEIKREAAMSPEERAARDAAIEKKLEKFRGATPKNVVNVVTGSIRSTPPKMSPEEVERRKAEITRKLKEVSYGQT